MKNFLPLLALLLSLLPATKNAAAAETIADKGIKVVANQKITTPDFFQRGYLRQGGFMIGKLPDISGDYPRKRIVAVIYNKRYLTLSPTGNRKGRANFFIAFTRNDTLEQQITFVLNGGKKITRDFQIKKSLYDIQRVDGVKRKYVTPDPEQVALIKKENRQIVNLRRTSDEKSFSPLEGFIWPASGPISGIYGSQRIFNGQPRSPHSGVDIAVKIGTPVRAPQSGTVVLAQHFFLSGGTMVIDHGVGVQSVFLHLDGFEADEGERVKQGQVVATSGNTGRTSGPHLHWQVNWYFKKFNPQLLVKNKRETKN